VAIGLIVGIIGALGTTRLIAGMLFQVSPSDTPTYVAMTVVLLGVASVAVWLPAKRAASLNPSEALRAE
jgi:ABC-type antimicrobial peptide transport system permease subunit